MKMVTKRELSWVATLISEKTDFKAKIVTKGKERYIHTTLQNPQIYAANISRREK